MSLNDLDVISKEQRQEAACALCAHELIHMCGSHAERLLEQITLKRTEFPPDMLACYLYQVLSDLDNVAADRFSDSYFVRYPQVTCPIERVQLLILSAQNRKAAEERHCLLVQAGETILHSGSAEGLNAFLDTVENDNPLNDIVLAAGEIIAALGAFETPVGKRYRNMKIGWDIENLREAAATLDAEVIRFQYENLLSGCCNRQNHCMALMDYAAYLVKWGEPRQAFALLKKNLFLLLPDRETFLKGCLLMVDCCEALGEVAEALFAADCAVLEIQGFEDTQLCATLEQFLWKTCQSAEQELNFELFHQAGGVIEHLHEKVFGMPSVECVCLLLQLSASCRSRFSNRPQAKDYCLRARKQMEWIYGPSDPLLLFLGFFEYEDVMDENGPRAAAEVLADAANLIQDVQADSSDALKTYLYENKKDLMDEAIQRTMNLVRYLDFNITAESLLQTVILQSMGAKTRKDMQNDLLRAMGLSPKFAYCAEAILNSGNHIADEQKINIVKVLPQMMHLENIDVASMSDEEKLAAMDTLESTFNMFLSMQDPNSAIGQFYQDVSDRCSLTAALGLREMNKLDKAEALLNELVARKQGMIITMSDAKLLAAKCNLYEREGRRGEAGKALEQLLDIQSKLVCQIFSTNEPQKKRELLAGMDTLTAECLHACFCLRGAGEAYQFLLRNRDLTRDAAVTRLGDAEEGKILAEYLRINQELEHVALNPAELEHTASLRARLGKLEQQMEQRSKGIFTLEPGDITAALQPGDVLLEFTRASNQIRSYYLAFILRRGWAVTAVRLGDAEELETLAAQVLDLFQSRGQGGLLGTQRERDALRELREQVISPLLGTVNGRPHRLIIAPDGIFCSFPFQLLIEPDRGEEPLQMVYINSGKELLIPRRVRNGSGALVLGNPDFSYFAPGTERYSMAKPLPASESEARRVAVALHTQPYLGRDAKKELLKRPARVIHIATHTYHEDRAGMEREPMEAVGLIFAGNERMSANEISRLNLADTELTVLSACGDEVRQTLYNEGVPGLRRAFVNAGTRYLIVNLWPADDIAAGYLMTRFYSYYTEKQYPVAKSLKSASLDLQGLKVADLREDPYFQEQGESVLARITQGQSRDARPYSHPYYWAGFILIGI